MISVTDVLKRYSGIMKLAEELNSQEVYNILTKLKDLLKSEKNFEGETINFSREGLNKLPPNVRGKSLYEVMNFIKSAVAINKNPTLKTLQAQMNSLMKRFYPLSRDNAGEFIDRVFQTLDSVVKSSSVPQA